MASDTAIKAAKWIFAGYYLEHGNSIDWLDMAYCQKKVWSIFGSDTSWDFSDGGYKAWCDKAQDRMDNLNKKPSFNNTNVGTIVAGKALPLLIQTRCFPIILHSRKTEAVGVLPTARIPTH